MVETASAPLKMDGEGVRNDIKTTFLIANTFNAMVAGVYPLSLCVGLMLGEGFLVIEPVLLTLAFGALMATLSALGYYAAFTENKKTLHTYSAIMGLVTALEVAGVAASSLPFINYHVDGAVSIFFIVHIGITLAAVSLAVALAKRTRLHAQSGPNKGERFTCFLKYLCCGILAVNIVFFLYVCVFSVCVIKIYVVQ